MFFFFLFADKTAPVVLCPFNGTLTLTEENGECLKPPGALGAYDMDSDGTKVDLTATTVPECVYVSAENFTKNQVHALSYGFTATAVDEDGNEGMCAYTVDIRGKS